MARAMSREANDRGGSLPPQPEGRKGGAESDSRGRESLRGGGGGPPSLAASRDPAPPPLLPSDPLPSRTRLLWWGRRTRPARPTGARLGFGGGPSERDADPGGHLPGRLGNPECGAALRSDLAPWRLTDPFGVDTDGEGAALLSGLQSGRYRMTWFDVLSWTTPPAVEIEIAKGEQVAGLGGVLVPAENDVSVLLEVPLARLDPEGGSGFFGFTSIRGAPSPCAWTPWSPFFPAGCPEPGDPPLAAELLRRGRLDTHGATQPPTSRGRRVPPPRSAR